jgi:hypothetical protein
MSRFADAVAATSPESSAEMKALSDVAHQICTLTDTLTTAPVSQSENSRSSRAFVLSMASGPFLRPAQALPRSSAIAFSAAFLAIFVRAVLQFSCVSARMGRSRTARTVKIKRTLRIIDPSFLV